jgi:hypothetical protein
VLWFRRPIKAKCAAALAASGLSEENKASIREQYAELERNAEHEVEHKQMNLNLQIGCHYNFLAA